LIGQTSNLPDGSGVELAVVDAGDDLDGAERERLHAALLEAQGEIDRREDLPAEQVISVQTDVARGRRIRSGVNRGWLSLPLRL
jgi:hypothetical protein